MSKKTKKNTKKITKRSNKKYKRKTLSKKYEKKQKNVHKGGDPMTSLNFINFQEKTDMLAKIKETFISNMKIDIAKNAKETESNIIQQQIDYAISVMKDLINTEETKFKDMENVVLVDWTNVKNKNDNKLQTHATKISENSTIIYIYDDVYKFNSTCTKKYILTDKVDNSLNLILNCYVDNECGNKCFKKHTFNESDDYVIILLYLYLKQLEKNVIIYSYDNYDFYNDDLKHVLKDRNTRRSQSQSRSQSQILKSTNVPASWEDL
jgi:hypothetical protein